MDNTTRSTSPFPPSSSAASGASSAGTESNKWSEQPHAADSLSSGASPLNAANAVNPGNGRDNATLDRVVKGAHDTVDRLAETAAPHVQRLQKSAEEMRHTGDEWSESLRTTVRANPLASVATALAVGVVLAKLTS